MARFTHPGWVSSWPAYGCPLVSTIAHIGYIARKEFGIVYDEASRIGPSGIGAVKASVLRALSRQVSFRTIIPVDNTSTVSIFL